MHVLYSERIHFIFGRNMKKMHLENFYFFTSELRFVKIIYFITQCTYMYETRT